MMLFLFLGKIFLIISVSCNFEYPLFYAIKLIWKKEISVFYRVGQCPIWKSTIDEFFLFKGDLDGFWTIDDVTNPEVNLETCSIHPQNDGINEFKLPFPYQLPKERGWTTGRAERSITLFELNVISSSSSPSYVGYSLSGEYEEAKETNNFDECFKEAKLNLKVSDEFLFVSATKYMHNSWLQRQYFLSA